MTKKKIAFVIGALTPGGAERVLSTLSNGLVKDFDVNIILFRKTKPFYPLDEKVKVISCFDTIEKPTSAFASIKLNFKILNRVSAIVKNEQIDLLIGFITSANIIATLAAKRNKIACLISERNDPLKKDIPHFWLILRKLVYPKADCLIAQTEKVKVIYQNMLKIDTISVLPNPISPKLSKLRDHKVKREKIILTVGRLNNDKRQDKLIHAFHKLNLTDWKVIIIGKGPNKVKLNALIDNYQLNDKIKILSEIKNIHDYYNKVSIFVFTSKAEGFPNALLEAMHFGLPSISTDCNYGPSDLIADGENGFLVPVNNQDIFVKKLRELINNENIKKSFSVKAKESTIKYEDTYVINSWKTLILKYLT